MRLQHVTTTAVLKEILKEILDKAYCGLTISTNVGAGMGTAQTANTPTALTAVIIA